MEVRVKTVDLVLEAVAEITSPSEQTQRAAVVAAALTAELAV